MHLQHKQNLVRENEDLYMLPEQIIEVVAGLSTIYNLSF